MVSLLSSAHPDAIQLDKIIITLLSFLFLSSQSLILNFCERAWTSLRTQILSVLESPNLHKRLIHLPSRGYTLKLGLKTVNISKIVLLPGLGYLSGVLPFPLPHSKPHIGHGEKRRGRGGTVIQTLFGKTYIDVRFVNNTVFQLNKFCVFKHLSLQQKSEVILYLGHCGPSKMLSTAFKR